MGATHAASATCDRSWSTEAFAADSKMHSWNDVVATHMTELHVGSHDPHRFKAHWRQFELDRIALNFIAAAPQLVRRTPQMVGRGGEATYELVHMYHGAMTVREGERTDVIRQGDFALLRNAVPYEFECAEDSLALTAHVDEAWLRSWLPDPACLRDLSSEARITWGQPLSGLLRAISDEGLDGMVIARSVLADQVGSLLQLIAGVRQGPGPRGRQTTLQRVRSLLRQRCSDPEIAPAALANEAGISKRHLHGLFASEGSTFGAELIDMRLEHAQSLLKHSGRRVQSISEIAYEVGFTDPSHFARRFRRRFGLTPTQWLALRAADD